MTAKKNKSAAKAQSRTTAGTRARLPGVAGSEKKNKAKAKAGSGAVKIPDKQKVRAVMEAAERAAFLLG